MEYQEPDALAKQRKLNAVHERAPIQDNLAILFADVSVGGLPFLENYRRAMSITGTQVGAFKQIRRALRAYCLMQYFNKALDLEGSWAECGVLLGFSASLMTELARARNRDFKGAGLHLIDSFEGLSQPTIEDAVALRDDAGVAKQAVVTHTAGAFAVPLERVQNTFRDYPDVSYHKGWIPQAFESLPEQKWSFVHIDVDLYEPTLASLEYFYPRMVTGGIILNDDYQSPFFPGGEKSWDDFCERNGLSFVALDSGQAVLIKA